MDKKRLEELETRKFYILMKERLSLENYRQLSLIPLERREIEEKKDIMTKQEYEFYCALAE